MCEISGFRCFPAKVPSARDLPYRRLPIFAVLADEGECRNEITKPQASQPRFCRVKLSLSFRLRLSLLGLPPRYPVNRAIRTIDHSNNSLDPRSTVRHNPRLHQVNFSGHLIQRQKPIRQSRVAIVHTASFPAAPLVVVRLLSPSPLIVLTAAASVPPLPRLPNGPSSRCKTFGFSRSSTGLRCSAISATPCKVSSLKSPQPNRHANLAQSRSSQGSCPGQRSNAGLRRLPQNATNASSTAASMSRFLIPTRPRARSHENKPLLQATGLFSFPFMALSLFFDFGEPPC